MRSWLSLRLQDGWLPLHRASSNNASEAVVLALLQAYPEGAKAAQPSAEARIAEAASLRRTILGVYYGYSSASRVREDPILQASQGSFFLPPVRGPRAEIMY